MWIDSKGNLYSAHADIRTAFKTVSLPAVLTDEALAAIGVVEVQPTEKPTPGPNQVVEETSPVADNGVWRQQWFVRDMTEAELAQRNAQARTQAKAARDAAVAAIKVTTTAGNTFDGDETSQTRMTRAILALQATGTPTVQWVLADNTAIDATAAELTEALALAGAAQAAMWLIEDQT